MCSCSVLNHGSNQYCLGTGKTKDYVKAFMSNFCNPVILVPGMMGSKLKFEMKDPEMFKKNHHDVVEACGWHDIKSERLRSFSIWINIDIDIQKLLMTSQDDLVSSLNKEEYIPHIFKRIKVFGLDINYPHKEGCYGALARSYYKLDEKGFLVSREFKGAIIRPASIKEISECGKNSVSNFLEMFSEFIRFSLGYSLMIKRLEALGYKLGLSLFVFPYDWRSPISEHYEMLNKTIQIAYSITKKKSILINHSMGGIISYNISRSSPELLDEVVVIGTPFLGTPKTLEMFFESDKSFDIEKNVNFMGIDAMIHTGIDETSKRMIFATQANKSLLFPKKILGDNIDEKIPETFSKLLNQDCYGEDCEIGTKGYYSKVSIELNGVKQSINSESQLYEFANKHKYFKYEASIGDADNLSSEKFEKKVYDLGLKNTDFTYLQQPNVPFTFIFSRHMKINTNFQIEETEGKSILKKTEAHMTGDGTVDTFSQIYPGLRWVVDKGNSKSSHPIHFIEYCSNFHNSKIDFNPLETQYLPISCRCKSKSHELNLTEDCSHSTMISDESILDFIETLIKSKKSNIFKIEGKHSRSIIQNSSSHFCQNIKLLFSKYEKRSSKRSQLRKRRISNSQYSVHVKIFN